MGPRTKCTLVFILISNKTVKRNIFIEKDCCGEIKILNGFMKVLNQERKKERKQ